MLNDPVSSTSPTTTMTKKSFTAPSVSTTPPRKKSIDRITPMNIEDSINTPPTRKKSTDSMLIDDDINHGNSSPVDPSPTIPSPAAIDPPQRFTLKVPFQVNEEVHLTNKEFNYTMKLMDEKINSIYKLCRYIGDQQREMATALKKLVALDELSENFWNVSYLYIMKFFFYFEDN